ncbi:hypothetical protein QA640_35380 [Bradyrhizobium sp. CB82]|uniref:hypothetical protein n=1 Tax=Bradyrhizobium sp. CB82 TaxID=3039159 RepID=UPI0024B10CE9|nr:hypothetical protein [Bradyrhizobium sp. CB82]WFU39592.1 hypothetical protein QA640_35380 [Bradyrhizobium sp. CB82]
MQHRRPFKPIHSLEAHLAEEANYRIMTSEEIKAAKLACERARRAFEQTRAALEQSRDVLEQSFKVLGVIAVQGQNRAQE